MSVVNLPAALEITHLDEDWAMPCERYPVPLPGQCAVIAEWTAWTVACCPQRMPVVLLCTGHRDELMAGEIGVCMHCGNEFSPTRAGYRLIEPLKRRSR